MFCDSVKKDQREGRGGEGRGGKERGREWTPSRIKPKIFSK